MHIIYCIYVCMHAGILIFVHMYVRNKAGTLLSLYFFWFFVNLCLWLCNLVENTLGTHHCLFYSSTHKKPFVFASRPTGLSLFSFFFSFYLSFRSPLNGWRSCITCTNHYGLLVEETILFLVFYLNAVVVKIKGTETFLFYILFLHEKKVPGPDIRLNYDMFSTPNSNNNSRRIMIWFVF